MSYPLSDEESSDSESGIRFKTESTRKKTNDFSFKESQIRNHRDRNSSDRSYDSQRNSYSSRSDRRHRDRSKERNYSRERHRSRSQEKRKSKKHKKEKRNKVDDNFEQERKYDSDDDDSLELKNVDVKCKNVSTIDKNEIGVIKKSDYGSNVSSELTETSVKNSEKCFVEYNPQNSKNIDPDESASSQIENKTKSDKTDNYGPVLPSKLFKNEKKIEVTHNLEIVNASRKPENTPVVIKIESDSEKSDNSDTYGPVLSSKLTHNSSENSDSKSNVKMSDAEKKDKNVFGPLLPPYLHNKDISSDTSSNISINSATEKQPNLTYDTPTNIFGPSIPTNPQVSSSTHNDKIEKPVLGPFLPPHLRENLKTVDESNLTDSDDDVIGPLPEGHTGTKSHKLLEERALEMKINALTPSEPEKIPREEWMTKLPDVRLAGLGLGPRQFRSKIGPDMSDRSSWTDTPEDKKVKTKKEVKIDVKEQAKLDHIAKRDKEQEAMVKKFKKKKKRDKALIDLHREKLKKKEKESDAPPERRPFDRDIDLKVNRFDDAQKKAILKKAQLLDTRFSCGESKFL